MVIKRAAFVCNNDGSWQELPAPNVVEWFVKMIIIFFSTAQVSCPIMAFNLSVWLLLKSELPAFEEPHSFRSLLRMRRV